MLEKYKQLLPRLRHDRAVWPAVAYTAGRTEDGVSIDLHARRRFGVILCLQYDRRAADHDLIRWLVTEEVASLTDEATAQGYTDALRIGVTLLARFRDIDDAWLFCRAKMSNFDTYCGLDTRYLLMAGVEATLAMVRARDHPDRDTFLELVTKDGAVMYSQGEVDAWWERIDQSLAASAAEEHPLDLVKQALEFGAIDEGRAFLDACESQGNGGASATHTIMYYRGQLGQPDRALACAQRLLEEVGDDAWERTSALLWIVRFAIQSGHCDVAWSAVVQAHHLLSAHPDWKRFGLARSAVEVTFDLAVTADAEISRRAFDLGVGLADQLPSPPLPLSILHKAAQAATKVGDARRAERYARLADSRDSQH